MTEPAGGALKIALMRRRIKHTPDSELHPPVQLRKRNSWKGLSQYFGVASDNRVELPHHIIDHKWLRIGKISTDQPKELKSSRRSGGGTAQQRADKRVKNRPKRHRLIAGKLLCLAKQSQAIFVNRANASDQDRLVQVFLGAKIVIHRCEVNPGFICDLPERRAREAVFAK